MFINSLMNIYAKPISKILANQVQEHIKWVTCHNQDKNTRRKLQASLLSEHRCKDLRYKILASQLQQYIKRSQTMNKRGVFLGCKGSSAHGIHSGLVMPSLGRQPRHVPARQLSFVSRSLKGLLDTSPTAFHRWMFWGPILPVRV